jgi:hypothetical protein
MGRWQLVAAIAAIVGSALLCRGAARSTDFGLTVYFVEVHGSLSTGIVINVRHPSGGAFVIERVELVEGTPWPPPTVPGQAPWPTYVPPRPKLYWLADGQSAWESFHSIPYGRPPQGLENKTGPELLIPGKLYLVAVHARGPKRLVLGPVQGYGMYEFELDEHGVVKKAW